MNEACLPLMELKFLYVSVVFVGYGFVVAAAPETS